jgi:hypothetical protein
MVRVAVVGVLAFSACSGRSPDVHDGSGAIHSTENDDEALRYERGNGVARDYTRAAQIYEKRCDQGHGDLVACRKLFTAIVKNRGEPRDRRPDVGWLVRGCQRGDWLSCVSTLVPYDFEKADAACEKGNPAACVAAMRGAITTQSGTVEFQDHERLERACDGALTEACILILATPRSESQSVRPEVVRRVESACRLGDADACDALKQPIAPSELCRANDFQACAAAGLAGDAVALERACVHGIPKACGQLAIEARDSDPPDPRVAMRFARACEVGAEDVCRQNRPVDLAIGCAGYQVARVPVARRLRLPPIHGTDARGKPWSAAPNRSYFIVGARAATPPAQLSEVGRRIAPSAVYVVNQTEMQPELFAPAIPVTLDPNFAASVIATAASPPEPGDPLAAQIGRGLPTIVDGTGTPRAVLSVEFGVVPATLARCVQGLLAEP